MPNITLAGLLIFCSVSYVVGYLAGQNGGFLNLFDVSDEFKQKNRSLWSHIEDKFFGADSKKDDLSAK